MEQPNKDKLNILSVIKFANEKPPVFKEDKKNDWVLYGADGEWKNRYPDFLIECLNRSPVHYAVVGSKVHYLVGNGFDVDDTGLSTIDAAKLLDLLKKANKYGETANDIAYKIAYDYITFGGVYVEIVWNKTGKDFDYYHMEYKKLRLDKEDRGFWYSDDWSKKNQSEEETGLKLIPFLDEENPKGSQILWAKRYTPGMGDYYPLPEYIGAVPYIQCDYEISNYHLNNIRSNFHIGTVINFNNGKPDDETKEYIENKLKEKFAGTDEAGSVLIAYNVSKENSTTVTRLAPSELDKQFEQLKKDVESSILIAHKVVSQMLFGVKTEGQLGGRDEIVEAYEIFKNTWVAPTQHEINKIFNRLLQLKKFNGRVKLKDAVPLTERLSEATLIKILSANELRDLAGYEPIANGDKVETAPEPPKETMISSVVHRFDQEHLYCQEFSGDLDKTLLLFKEGAIAKDSVEIVFSKTIENFDEAFLLEAQFADEEDVETPKKVPKVLPRLKVLYSYEPRVGLKPTIPTTRDFCREMLEINGLYTRAQIDAISDKVGWNVWRQRGGFWRIKGTDQTRDYCRHVWQQHIVKLK